MNSPPNVVRQFHDWRGKDPKQQAFDAMLFRYIRVESDGKTTDYIQFDAPGQTVTMRKSDFSLNASEILHLARQSTNERAHRLRDLRKLTEVWVEPANKYRPYRSSWVSYDQGVLLCRELQVADVLKPLLNHAYDLGYQGVSAEPTNHSRNFLVTIRKPDLWVNATHILKATGAWKKEMEKVRRNHRYEIVRGGRADLQGTYVEPEVGVQLCQQYRLDDLGRLLLQELRMHGYERENLVQKSVGAAAPGSISEDSDNADFKPGTLDTVRNEGAVEKEKPESVRASIDHGRGVDFRKSDSDSDAAAVSQKMLDPRVSDSLMNGSLSTSLIDTGFDTAGKRSKTSSENSFFTQPSFSRGSFLPPIKGSFLCLVQPGPVEAASFQPGLFERVGNLEEREMLGGRKSEDPSCQTV